MSLPYDYKFEFDFFNEDFLLLKQKLKSSDKVKNLIFSNDKFEFNFNIGFAGIFVKTVLFKGNDKINCSFVIEDLLKIYVIIDFIFVFLAKNFETILIFSVAFLVVLYAISIFHIKNSLIAFVEEIIANQEEENFSQQIKWTDDNNVCPACGNPISEYDIYCIDCGINLEKWRKTKKQKNISRSGFFQQKIQYNFKKK
jgi:uncharacterized membrane protein